LPASQRRLTQGVESRDRPIQPVSLDNGDVQASRPDRLGQEIEDGLHGVGCQPGAEHHIAMLTARDHEILVSRVVGNLRRFANAELLFIGQAPDRGRRLVLAKSLDHYGIGDIHETAGRERERALAGARLLLVQPGAAIRSAVRTDAGTHGDDLGRVYAFQFSRLEHGRLGVQQQELRGPVCTASIGRRAVAERENEHTIRNPLRDGREPGRVPPRFAAGIGEGILQSAVLQPDGNLVPIRHIAAHPVHEDDQRRRVDRCRVIVSTQCLPIGGLEGDLPRLRRQGWRPGRRG